MSRDLSWIAAALAAATLIGGGPGSARAQPGATPDADDDADADADADARTDARTDTDDDSDDDDDEPTPKGELPDQALAGAIGTAAGGRTTAGGLRVGGRYLYRLSRLDWFEGHVAFTFGSGSAECFRDRQDAAVCDHGVADGFAGEIGAGIRRRFAIGGQFEPFVRVAAGARIVRFGADDVQGVAIPLVGAGGVRFGVTDGIGVSAEAALEVGLGFFNHDLGTEPQAGFAIAALADFEL